MSEEPQLDELIASYHRCRVNGDFIGTFYDIFLSKSPDIAARFGDTDFSVQKLMLRESLLEMLCFDQGMDGAQEDIKKLGKRHCDLQITKDMYDMWLDALCETVSKHDPKMTPQLETRWRTAMRKGIETMLGSD